MIRPHQLAKTAFLGIALWCVAFGNLHAQVTDHVLRRVMVIRAGDKAGTAFTIEVDGRQYLITARHVVADLKAEDTVQYLKNKTWQSLPVQVAQYDKIKAVDIAVLVPLRQLTVSLETSLGA